jgi:yjeF C-terminal region, hydroxyethylthiazole kinase-related/yjeF N-terminal region
MHTTILSVLQIRESERHTMESQHITSLELMERAGTATTEAILQWMEEIPCNHVFVFCGTGNNGGDGLVVACQLATGASAHIDTVTVVLCQSPSSRQTPEFKANYTRWEKLKDIGRTRTISFNEEQPLEIPADALVIDAIFGIGLNKPAAGIQAAAIRAINASDAPVVAIDTPSGLFADQHTPHTCDIVMADLTLSMQFQKLAFLLPENHPFYGYVQVLDIGISMPPTMKVTQEMLTTNGVRPLLRPRFPYAHKGTFGNGLLIAGSASMPGAAILAATAAMRGGIGKLTLHTAAKAASYVPAALPEAILHTDIEPQHVSRIDWHTLPPNINAIAIGPGLGTHPKTVALVKDVLDSVQAPIILDADALNILADNKTRLAFLPQGSILTPHFAEFERLAGHANDDFQRVEMARTFSQRYNIVLILKGHHTVISLPDGNQFFNTTGNDGMATAGSGDVLTGLLLALLAQGYNPVAAALLGVHIHGLAGDLYVQENASHSLIASDLPQYFGKAIRFLQSKTQKA